MNPNNTEQYRLLERKAYMESYGNKNDPNKTSSILIFTGIVIVTGALAIYNGMQKDYNIKNATFQNDSTRVSKDSLEYKLEK